MDSQSLHRLVFVGEWYQEEAGMERTFFVYFFPLESSVELFEVKTRKMFLKRTKIKDLTEKDFFIGAKLNIFGRQIEILDYGDNLTRAKLTSSRKRTLIILKANILNQMGKIITVLNENGFYICNGRMCRFNIETVRKFFGDKKMGDVELSVLISKLVAAPCVGFEIVAENAVEKIKSALAQNGTATNNANTLRILLEDEEIRNGIICSQSEEEANSELQFFFDSKNGVKGAVTLKNSTLAIIKPHAVKEGKAGPIITEIYEHGFTITGLKMLLLERANCEEFYEVYRGVLSEYIQMVAHLASGVCMVLELTATDETKNAHEEFRKFCGPMDTEIARQLRPNTLRAKYGKDKIMNAVHCTDLPEDTLLELEYFFKILE